MPASLGLKFNKHYYTIIHFPLIGHNILSHNEYTYIRIKNYHINTDESV